MAPSEVEMRNPKIVVERTATGFSYSPDVPGCVATGKTTSEVWSNMQSAIRAHKRVDHEFNHPSNTLPRRSTMSVDRAVRKGRP